MDQKRLAQLGRRQTWLRPQDAEGFDQTYPSEMIGRILLRIREACDEAKKTYLPTEILVILYGLGNPAIGCHMDCTKDFADPDAIITPTMILKELPPDRDVTLAMRMFTTRPWAHIYTLQGTQLDKVKRAYPDAYRQAGADGTLIKQYFTEEDALDYQNSKRPELLTMYYHDELALWIRQYPKDTDGTALIEDRISRFMRGHPGEPLLQTMRKQAMLATAVHFRLSMAFLTDNMTAHFKLKRPMDETCLEWNMSRWIERRSNLTRSNKWYELFKKAKEIETGAGLLWSGYTRFCLYLRAAHFETYLAEEELKYTPGSINMVLADLERFFKYILNEAERMASVCKGIVDESIQYGDETLREDMPRERYESLKRIMWHLSDIIYEQCAVVPPRSSFQ
ncbi:ORF20 [Fusarium mexicanum]|uniref:ORF20 n=1 Tax=Fusarium mexicanum TaxID=751941 RepID=A0A8H5JLU9_9HYPO|nr:ORF20 [Fusarium mexicanum]